MKCVDCGISLKSSKDPLDFFRSQIPQSNRDEGSVLKTQNLDYVLYNTKYKLGENVADKQVMQGGKADDYKDTMPKVPCLCHRINNAYISIIKKYKSILSNFLLYCNMHFVFGIDNYNINNVTFIG